MKTRMKIVTKNAKNEEQVSIDATIQLKAAKRGDTQSVIKGLILKLLSCEDIMNTFNLRSSDMAYVAEQMVNRNDNEFEINMLVDKNALSNHHIIIGPRPFDERKNNSFMLNILVQFEKTDE